MRSAFASLIVVACFAVASLAENKGSCPPAPPVERHRPTSKAQESTDTITLLVVLSDAGYVCSAQVIHAPDKKSGVDAVSTVRQWHFEPAKKDGRRVPVLITVEVKYERDKDGNIILRLAAGYPLTPADGPHDRK